MNTIKIYLSITVVLIFNTAFGELKTSSKKVVHQKEFNEVQRLINDNKSEEAINILKNIKLEQLDSVLYYTSLSSIYSLRREFSKSSYYINEAEKLAKSTHDDLDDAYFYYGKGRIELFAQQNNKAASNTLQAINILKQYKDQDLFLGFGYYQLTIVQSKLRIYSNDYKNYSEQSLRYARKANYTYLINLVLIDQTLFYELKYNEFGKKEDLDKLFSIMDELRRIITNTDDQEKISNRLVIVFYNNSASYINSLPYKNLSKIERAKIAEKDILKALELCNKNPELSEMKGLIYTTFGEIKLNLGDLKAAENYFLKVYNNISAYGGDLFFKKIATSLLSDLYKNQKNYEKALKFKNEEFKYSIESYKQQAEDNSKFLEANFATEQRKLQIAQLKEKNESYSKQKILYIGIASLAILGVIFLLYMLYYKIKVNKQKTDLLEAKRFEAELNLDLEREEKARIKAEQELLELQQEQLNKHALATSLQLKQKTSFLNELKEKLKEKESFNLDRILKDERLVDDDFHEIQNIIKEVHPNFFNRLKEVSKSKLTNQDLKYAAYLYLNMDNMQIANLMKVESKTVRMAKYRMKQKIGLDKEADLQTFIQSLIK